MLLDNRMELDWREQSLVLWSVEECLTLQHIGNMFNFDRGDACHHHRVIVVSRHFRHTTSSLLFSKRHTWLITIKAIELRQFAEYRLLFSSINTYVWLAMAGRHNILFNLHSMIYFVIIHLFGRRTSFRKLFQLVKIVFLFRVLIIICLIKVSTWRSAHFVIEKVLCDGQIELLFVLIREHTLVMFYLFCGLATLLTCLVINHIRSIVKLEPEITDTIVHYLLDIVTLCGYCPAIFILLFWGGNRHNFVEWALFLLLIWWNIFYKDWKILLTRVVTLVKFLFLLSIELDKLFRGEEPFEVEIEVLAYLVI